MHYTSCFIGIPLPLEFESKFQDAASEVLAIVPTLDIVDVLTPHITVYYLNEQSQMALEGIAARVRKHIKLLAGSRIEVGSIGVFGGKKPRVLYLQSKCPEPVYTFKDRVAGELTQYRAADNDLGFIPHITLARIKETNRGAFLEREDEISDILEKVNWSFEIKEVCIYGVDSRKKPEHQRRLVTFGV